MVPYLTAEIHSPSMSTDTPNDPATDVGSLPDPVISEVLEAPRRRRLLAHLFDADEAVPVLDLARRIAAEERGHQTTPDGPSERVHSNDGVDPDSVAESAIDDVKADIYATHLPKLTALRIVEFDSLLASVAPAENGPEVRERLGADR